MQNLFTIDKKDRASTTHGSYGSDTTYVDDEILDFVNLESLDVSNNQFQEFPMILLKLQKLKELNLSYCELKSLPSELVQLPNLTKLDISQNLFTEIPSVVFELENLEELIIHPILSEYDDSNVPLIQNIPEEISKLKKLKTFVFQYEPIKSLPNTIVQLENLEVLNLEGCFELTQLPNDLSKLKNLKVLNIKFTKVEELPEGLKQKNDLEIEMKRALNAD